MLDALADAEGLAIQVHAGQSTVRRGDHESLESWHGGKGLQAKAVRVGGHHAPCEDFDGGFQAEKKQRSSYFLGSFY